MPLIAMKSLFSRAIFILVLWFAQSQAALPKLTLNHNASETTVRLSGDDGLEYLLESSPNPVENWSVLSSFLLNDDTRVWREPTGRFPTRFYRARTVPETEDQWATDFGLLDQYGKAHNLYYFFGMDSLQAIVLIFAEGNYQAFASKIRTLKSNPLFENSVFFWTIEMGANNTRTNIVREAEEFGIDWPVLHDPLHLVARDYGARFNGEAFLIRRSDMQILYRGLIDDAEGDSPPATPFLATALSNLVAATPITITRMEPTQNPMTEQERPVADYSTVIAPLLQAKCVTCHSPGNIGPFAMVSHRSVLEHAESMKGAIMSGHMPPWHADPEYGKFKNDISLSRIERAILVDWLHAGAPRFGSSDPLTNVPPPPPKWPADLGPPDQIIKLPRQNIPAVGHLEYRYIYARATNNLERWLRAAVVKPSNPAVVHHYNVWEGRVASALVLAAYSPGRTEGPYPEGTGWRLKPEMEMTFELHYNATGQEEFDEPELALWYATEPPGKTLKAAAPQDPTIEIPPNNRDF